MLTRRAKLQALLALEDSESSSTILSDSSAESKETTSTTQAATSNKTIQTTPKMSDADTALSATLRKRLERIHSKTHRIREQLAAQRDRDDPSTINFKDLESTLAQLEIHYKDNDKLSEELYEVEDDPTALANDEVKADEYENDWRAAKLDYEILFSRKTIFANITALESAVRCVTTAYEANPDGDHKVALNLVLTRSKDLETELLSTSISQLDALIPPAKDILERATLIQSRVSKNPLPDVKPSHSHTSGRSGVKLRYQEVPEFSGKTEDWLTFLGMFKNAVHNNPDLETATKLQYLVQSLKDPVQKAIYADRMEEDGAYEKFLEELTLEYDRPRWLHRRYCDQMRTLTTNPHTRPGLKELVSKLTTIHTGFIRLKTENVSQVLTSMAEAVMDKKTQRIMESEN